MNLAVVYLVIGRGEGLAIAAVEGDGGLARVVDGAVLNGVVGAVIDSDGCLANVGEGAVFEVDV